MTEAERKLENEESKRELVKGFVMGALAGGRGAKAAVNIAFEAADALYEASRVRLQPLIAAVEAERKAAQEVR